MGFFPVNKVRILRDYVNPKQIVVSVFDEVLRRWERKRFSFDDIDGALSWAGEQLRKKAM